MAKKTFYVKGMHCASCEVLVEKELLSIPGIVFADASLVRSSVNLEYDKESPSLEKLNAKFEPLGYSFSKEAFEEKSNGWKIPLIALSAIAIFLVISKSGLSSLINVSSESSLTAFFVFGFIAGISSCAALIGGLILSLSKKWLEDFGRGGGFTEKAKPHLLFNLGRLIS
ncbi:MAG TPA: heavy-metal-associated domain-containing protein, partial [Candidatus Colwellbacteria bacterium]|nr:heavy-metal-associated domain-containing protein [Candidatus Colwellbacteria bacterium]